MQSISPSIIPTFDAALEAPTTPRPALPMAALEGVAARARAAGLMFMKLADDGAPIYLDREASPFFTQFAVPMIERARRAGLQPAMGTLPEAGMTWRPAAGLTAAAFPRLERRRQRGTIVLVARDADFAITPETIQLSDELRLDATWLMERAAELPAYTAASLLRHGGMLVATVQEELRFVGMQTELNSLSTQLSDTYEELSLIYQISSGMKINRRAAEFFKQSCDDVRDVMRVRAMGVTLECEIGSRLEPVAHGAPEIPADMVTRLNTQLMVEMKRRKSALLVNDVAGNSPFAWFAPHAARLMAVPLQRQEQVLGCIYALDPEAGEDFDSVHSKLLTSIANETAVFVENTMLFDDVHGLMMGLLHSLTSAVDAKDAYTCGHSERVALVSRHLAQQMGLGERDVEQVYMAGLLHDVGKIGVPEAVLQKAGKLTNEEFELIKKHPAIGAKILQDVKQIREIIPGVMHHHERFDGKGYPGGLSGDAIPLLGRIICLADSFDAMTSSRTYRKALPLEVALSEIRRCSGTHFDPALAEIFLRTGAEGFRELLSDHSGKAKKLRELQETLRAA